jgi:hypothetical protein
MSDVGGPWQSTTTKTTTATLVVVVITVVLHLLACKDVQIVDKHGIVLSSVNETIGHWIDTVPNARRFENKQ